MNNLISNKEFIIRMMENAKKNALPAFGTIELTPYCNLDCKMCYIHLYDSTLKERMLSGQKWIELIDKAIEKGMFSCLVTGGEAMMHPDFWDIYMHLINKGIQIRLKTNGLLLTEENVKKLEQFQPFMVDVSLYGCNDESYEAVTGKRVFDTIIGNIKNAIAHNIPLKINIVPSKFMMPWLDEIVTLAVSLGVNVNINRVLIEPNKNTNRSKDEFNITLENIHKIKEISKKLSVSKIDVNDDTIEEDENNQVKYELPEKGLVCNGGKCTFYISWDGIMKPCISFPDSIISENVLEVGFEKAWNSVHKQALEYEIPQECRKCEYNKKCRYCPGEHGEFAKVHKCDPEMCKQWKTYNCVD